MKLGLSLGMGKSSGVATAFSPVSLSPLAFYDISDTSTLFQDTAGTTAVTADGQTVARINDKSGNANHLLQGTAGNRPTYRTAGGLHWLEFDGAGDGMAAAFTGAANFDRFSALKIADWTHNRYIFSGNGNYNGGLRQLNASPAINMTSGGSTSFVTDPTPALNTDFVLQERFNGASSSATVDASTLSGTTGSGAPDGLSLGEVAVVTTPAMRVYSICMFSSVLSAGNALLMRTFMGSKQGRVL